MLRSSTAAILVGLSALALAQDSLLGTKADIVSPKTAQPPATPVVSGLDMVQLFFALAVVFVLLKYALPKLIAKFGKRLSPTLNSSIEIEESANFGGGNLQVVKVRGKTLLLAVAPSGVTCLADLTDADQKPSEPAFFELFDQAKTQEEPLTHAVVQTPAAPKPNPKVKAYQQAENATEDDENLDLKERLRRLSQLVN